MKATRLIPLHTGAIGIRAGLACECQSVDGPEPLMDFIASDGRVDRYNEVIDQRGWQLENFRANPVIPDCHDYSSIARILGHAVNVEVKNGRLHNRVRFCTDNPLGNLAWKMTRAGFVRSQSVGFIPLEWRNGSGPEEPDRIYTKAELLEISLVVVPANPGATIGLAYKSGALDRSDLQSASDFLRTLSNQNLGTRDQSIHLLDLARTLRTAFEPISPSPRSSRREETHSVSAQRSQLAPSKHRDPRSLSPGSSRREETHSISPQRSNAEPKIVSTDPLNS